MIYNDRYVFLILLREVSESKTQAVEWIFRDKRTIREAVNGSDSGSLRTHLTLIHF